jgi:hypothetical protein
VAQPVPPAGPGRHTCTCTNRRCSAGVCADTPILAERLAREAQIADVPVGYLTNLTDLADGFVQGL